VPYAKAGKRLYCKRTDPSNAENGDTAVFQPFYAVFTEEQSRSGKSFFHKNSSLSIIFLLF
jgi:hypothetical protein